MKIIRRNVWQTEQSLRDGGKKWSFWNDLIPYNDEIISFNTRSGAILLLNKDELNELKNVESQRISQLYEIGVFVDAECDELAKWSKDYCQGKNDNTIVDMTIQLTQQCQFQCVYCFEGEEKGNHVLTDKASLDIRHYIERRAPELKVLHITWFGGEPLLGINRIRELSPFFLDICKKYGIRYYADMTTNGYTLTPTNSKILFDECQVKRFIITIDGTKNVHDVRRPLRNGKGTFDIIWNNISNLLNLGATVTIRMTIDKSNVDDVRPFIDYIARSEYARKVHIIFTKTFAVDSTPDNIRKQIYTDNEFSKIEMDLIEYAHKVGLLDFRTPRPTPLGGCLRKGDMAIGTDGEIYKCNSTMGSPEWITGYVGDTNNKEEPDWYKAWLSWEPAKRAKCKICKLQPLCNGGCPHNTLFSSKMHGSEVPCPDWIQNYKEKVIRFVKDAVTNKAYEEI
ncbi:SPASM domain-containing protein [Prevotella communis]|uniref:radical SAM/SPASM domain-containing protein n=1 Tax=Prevotella communis TaxID=2913614 RepID=UPI001EDB8BA3|nr:radical SAM protein [Prevotella communis]UKK58770.1 SPASM domain-containing protein [Prevotella communis]